MSDDVIRWCKKDEYGQHEVAAYTLLPIYHKNTSSRCASTHADERLSEILMQNLRLHRNCNRINRDISDLRRTCSDNSDRTCDRSSIHSPTAVKSRSRNFRLLNLCLVIVLHLICNGLVTNVNCDELLDLVGARGHFTHTWAVHIPGGDDMAEKVAADHGMYLRGKVSQTFILNLLRLANKFKLINSNPQSD